MFKMRRSNPSKSDYRSFSLSGILGNCFGFRIASYREAVGKPGENILIGSAGRCTAVLGRTVHKMNMKDTYLKYRQIQIGTLIRGVR
jgi:hypothetical protein